MKFRYKNKQHLRDHAARNLNFCCTLFLGVCFRFWGKGPMYTEPYEPSNRLLGVETVTKQIGWKQHFWDFTMENSTFQVQIYRYQTSWNGHFLIPHIFSGSKVNIPVSNSPWYFSKVPGILKKQINQKYLNLTPWNSLIFSFLRIPGTFKKYHCEFGTGMLIFSFKNWYLKTLILPLLK